MDIQAIEKRFPWSFLGAIVGVVGVVIAFLFFYLSKRDVMTDLRFVVEDEFKLIELKEKFDDIRILFKTEDIIDSKKEIKIIRLMLRNQGRPILQSYFDQTMPFGLMFDNSVILSASITDSQSEYLKNNLFPTKDRTGEYTKGQLVFGKPIIEKDARVAFKIYVLQEEGVKETKVRAFGKILGMDVIPVDYQKEKVDIEQKHQTPTLYTMIIGFIAGYVGMVGCLITLIAFFAIAENERDKLREKKALEFLRIYPNITEDRKKIIFSYIEGWPRHYLYSIRKLLAGSNIIDASDILNNIFSKLRRPFPMLDPTFRRIKGMIPLEWSSEIFVVKGTNVSLVEEQKKFLQDFLVALGKGKIDINKLNASDSDPTN